MTSLPDLEPESVAAAAEVLDRHFAALNAGDAAALAQTLHFPHYRLGGARMQVWERRSLWVVSRIEGRWAAQLRSSFAG